MAHFTHECENRKCGWIEFDNEPTSPQKCPQCGAPVSHFDDEIYSNEDFDSNEEPDFDPDFGLDDNGPSDDAA